MEGEEKGKMQNEREIQAKKKADCKELGVKWKEEIMKIMNVAMAQVGEELNEEMDNWCENRKGWVNDRVKDCIAERKSENRKYRYMRKT